MAIETFNEILEAGVETEFEFAEDSAFVLVNNNSIHPIELFLKDDSDYNATPVTILAGRSLPLPIVTDAVKLKSEDGGRVSVVCVPTAQYGQVGATGADGSDGEDGLDGADGEDAFVYIAYASDDQGAGFTQVFNPSLDYIGIISTTTPIGTLQASDFAGMWKNYKGTTGDQGPQGDAGADGADGEDGATGPEGPQGEAGPQAFFTGHIHGLKLNYSTASAVQILAGECRSDDDTTDLIVTSTLTGTISSSGANGLDTGSEASNTFYYVWVIYNPTTDTYAALLSTSSTSPTMPSGYTKKRLVGVVRNDASSDFYQFTQFGLGHERKYLYQEDQTSTLRILTGGTATSYTAVNVTSFIPAISACVLAILYVNVATQDGYLRMGSPTTDYYFFEAGTASYLETFYNISGSDLAYKVVSGGSMDVSVVGFYMEV